ncbi:ran [Drosophila busckii]|uniref:Ran n=1 Tax=Drosophila busckii TaxID=30019 RepID=A0A0M4DZJ7_DROBS|nr:ran [Drosophila busckii]
MPLESLESSMCPPLDSMCMRCCCRPVTRQPSLSSGMLQAIRVMVAFTMATSSLPNAL